MDCGKLTFKVMALYWFNDKPESFENLCSNCSKLSIAAFGDEGLR